MRVEEGFHLPRVEEVRQLAVENAFQIKKTSFSYACRRAVVSQQPASYRGQVLTPTQVRRMGNCPSQVNAVPAATPSRPRA